MERRWRTTAALVVGSIALALGVVEMFLRFANLQVMDLAYNSRKYGRLITYDAAGGFTRHIPHASGAAHGAAMRFNAFGMRDVEHALAKPPGARRVLVLGDSIVAGLGEPFEGIFPRRLETLLNTAAPRGPVEVIAAAVPGWNTVAERNYLRAEGLRFDPDLVVLLYVTNDNEILLPWGLRPPLPPVVRAWQWLTDHSRLVELATFAYRRRWPSRPDPGGMRVLGEIARARAAREKEHHMFEPDDPGWLASREALDDIAATTRTRGIPLLVVLLNMGGPDAPAVTARLAEFAAASGVPVVDAFPWFGGRPVTELVNGALHPNALTHRILAERTAELVAERALLR